MWLDTRRVDSSDGTAPTGTLGWAQPTTDTIPIDGLEDILLPSGVAVIKERTCAALYAGDMFLTGGFSQNLRVTTGLRAWIQGITPPSTPILAGSGSGNIVGVVAATGPGLTAVVIPYLSWWDEATQEDSPLSAAGPSLDLVNQLIAFTNLPTSKPEDDSKALGTTVANAATTVTGIGTRFLTDVRVGDQVSLSSDPTEFAGVVAVNSDTSLVVTDALGDGTSQTINVRRLMRPTHIRIWYSVDGSLPRIADQREVGCTASTPAILTIGDLGEASTEIFDRFDRGKYSVAYHDRQYMAGFDEHPNRICCSLIGQPEKRSTIDLTTKSGAPVTGLYMVRDTLFVGLAQGHDRITGWTEDDIEIDSIAPNLGQQPGLGLTCHFAVGLLPDGSAVVPTQFGHYLNDGSSLWPLNLQNRRVYTDDFARRPDAYQDTFCYVDAVRHVYAMWLGEHPLIPKAQSIETSEIDGTTDANLTLDIVGAGTSFLTDLSEGDQISLDSDPTNFSTVISIEDDEHLTLDIPIGDGTAQGIGLRSEALVTLSAYLVLDYKPILPLEGGGVGQPNLAWDTQARVDEFAAVLLMPGARSGSVVTGSCDGNIYRRNVEGELTDSDDIGLKRLAIIGNADDGGEPGGDFMHGKKWGPLELYAQCEDSLFTLGVYPGDEYAYPNADDLGIGGTYRGPIKKFNRLGSSRLRASITGGGTQGTFEAKTVWHLPLKGVSGRRLTLAITAVRVGNFHYMGYLVYWKDGVAPRRINRILEN